jgi:hypothetical protein
MIAPTLLLLSALFVLLDPHPSFVSRTAWNRLRAGTVALVLVAALVSFSVGDSVSRGSPAWSDALDGARSECARKQVNVVEVPISPTSTGFTIPLPCTELLDVSART